MSKQKVKVPDSLRDVLLEFSIAYLLEQPGDVIDFAVDFFTKLQTNRAQTGIGIGITKPTTPDDSIVSQDEGELRLARSLFVFFRETLFAGFLGRMNFQESLSLFHERLTRLKFSLEFSHS
jgi:hypothetical protein